MADELIALFGKITTNDHETLVDQFSKILQVDPHVATFFLEASSWSVETAVQNYLASQPNGFRNNIVPLTSPPQATFTGDLAPWQSRAFQPGTRLPIRLQFQNTGTSQWPSGTCLIFVDGERMSGYPEIPISAGPGQVVEVVLVLNVPSSEGTHMGSWRLACSAGYFGEPVYMIVHSHPMAQPVTFDPKEFEVKTGVTDISQRERDQAQVDQLLSMAASSWNVGDGHQNHINQGSNGSAMSLEQQMMLQQQQMQQNQQSQQQQGGFAATSFNPPGFQFAHQEQRDDSMTDSL